MIWLAATTRVLENLKNHGHVLPHLWLQRRQGIGKTYAMKLTNY